MATQSATATPREAIRAVALGVFDAIDAHPWVGTQLSREPWQPAVLQILEARRRPARGARRPERGTVRRRVGAGELHARPGRPVRGGRPPRPHGADRAEFLGTVAARWAELDPVSYPFVPQLAGQLPDHDDREQFLAGIDLILAGIATICRRPSRRHHRIPKPADGPSDQVS